MLEGGSQYGVPPLEGEMASPISTLPHHQFPGNGLAAAAEEEEDHGGAAAGGAGNRWPRQETLSLLRIRSEMDSAFRDATLKAPLWEDVSRKLAELGYKRSAKKCKEKFENIHKYYKRTKEGRAGRQDGKNYRFFSELEALYSGGAATHPGTNPTTPAVVPSQSEASTSSNDSDSDGGEDKKMMSFFKGLIRQVVDRQEAMQNRFLETIEKREQERMMREEAWRRQDMARLAREHEAAAHDRAVAAARDAAIISFLQQLAGQPLPPPPPPPPPPMDDIGATSSSQKAAAAGVAGGRWPKSEVQALIKLRGEMEIKYQEVGPKGPLWEEISSEMRRIGYSRSAKRCKEKWENINKYFKKVKESNKRRPEDSKTCPYFHQLDAIYRKKHVLAAADGGTASSKVGDGVMDLTRREEDGERANSEEMVSDEGEREEEQYKIEYQPNSEGNGNINGGGAIYGHNSEKNQDQRPDLSPLSAPIFQG